MNTQRLYECTGCGSLYQVAVTECDCSPGCTPLWRDWIAAPRITEAQNMPPLDIDTASHSGQRIRGYSIERVQRQLMTIANSNRQWIAVSDELPEQPKDSHVCSDVIVLLPNKRRALAMIIYSFTGPKWLDQESRIIHPTHWMPLPQSAEEDPAQ